MTSNRLGPCAPCTRIFSISAMRLEPPNDRGELSGGRVFLTNWQRTAPDNLCGPSARKNRAPYHLGILENLNEMFRTRHRLVRVPGVEPRPATRLIFGKLEWRTQAGATP